MRISKEEYYMNIAVQVSLRSTCIRRKVGALIVKENEILGTGYNGSPKGLPNCCDNPDRCYRTKHNIPSGEKLELCYAQHAEINALFSAIKAGKDLIDASVYVTTFPCSNCAKALIQSGIKEIYYLDNYTNEFTLKMLDEAGIEVIEMNSEIYQTPLVDGADRHTDNDLDYIDPLIKEIYKYDIGTTSFKENRKKVLDRFPNLIEDENVVFISNINELYKESFLSNSYLNLYSNGNIAIPADNSDELFDMANLDEVLQYSFINRQEAEYSGLMEVNDRSKRHCVVAGLVMDKSRKHIYLLKSLKGRLKNKYTLVQGHMSDRGMEWCREDHLKHIANLNMNKEFQEEVVIKNPESSTVVIYDPKALIMLSDNKISEDHIGFLYIITVPDDAEIVSNEPDKHEVVKFKKGDIIPNLDTWAKTFLTHIR